MIAEPTSHCFEFNAASSPICFIQVHERMIPIEPPLHLILGCNYRVEFFSDDVLRVSEELHDGWRVLLEKHTGTECH